MVPFEIKTPSLKLADMTAADVIQKLQTGELEHKTASLLLNAARTLQSGVKAEISARQAAPKIAALEAKLIEVQNKQGQIENLPS